jgi:hypothetical protein
MKELGTAIFNEGIAYVAAARSPPNISLSRTVQPDMANAIAIGLAPVTGPSHPINRFWRSVGESFQSTTTDHRACACGTTFSPRMITGRTAFFFLLQNFTFFFLMEKRGTSPVPVHFPECAKVSCVSSTVVTYVRLQQCGG